MDEIIKLIKRIENKYEDIKEYKADYVSIATEDVEAILEYLKWLEDISEED